MNIPEKQHTYIHTCIHTENRSRVKNSVAILDKYIKCKLICRVYGKGSTSPMNIFTPDGKNKHKKDYGV